MRHLLIILAVLVLHLVPTKVRSEPFESEPMPADFDGVVTVWRPSNSPVAADFNGDGQTSWYAGGNRIAHQYPRTPLHPLRYDTAALPGIGIGGLCPSCVPQGRGFAVGDVNRDGLPDIVRLVGWDGHAFYYTLQVYIARADGGFDLGWRLDEDDLANVSSGQRTFQMILGDFDRDGDNDLAVLSTFDTTDDSGSIPVDRGNLYIRWNASSQFSSKTTLQSTGFDELANLAAADFDHDGDLDLLADRRVIWSSSVDATVNGRRYDNDGAGTFSASNVDGFWFPLGFADLNRDSWPDFVGFYGQPWGAIGWRSNTGDGNFNGAGPLAQSDTQQIVYAAIVADFNEDSLPDLISLEDDEVGRSRQVVLRRGNGNGVVNIPDLLHTYTKDIIGLGHGDARADADEDILLRFEDNSYELLRNTAQRLLPKGSASTQVAALAGVSRIEVADANRDGATDVFALQTAAKHLNRILGAGHQGGFGAAEFKSLATGTSDFTVGDYNRDGRPDLAWVVPATGVVRRTLQTNDAYFFWPEANVGTIAGAEHILTGNGALMDGRPDLLVSSGTSGELTWFRNQNDAASWAVSQVVASQDPVPDTLTLVPNYFGYADAAFGCGDSEGLFELNGYSNVLGWGLTASVGELADSALVRVCAAADIDPGGQLELVFQDGEGRLVWWTPVNTPPIATHIIDQNPIGTLTAIEPTDWNRDGLTDLLVAGSAGLDLYYREFEGGEWKRQYIYPSEVLDVVSVDSHEDSRPDAIVVVPGEVRLVRNQSSIAYVRDAVIGPDPVVVGEGDSGVVASLEIVNPGVYDEDASIAVDRARVAFRKAVSDGMGGWTRGAAMTPAEVQQAVNNVSIRINGQFVASAGAAAVAGDGTLQITYNILGNVVPVPPEDSRYMEIHVSLRSDATSASYSSFFVDTAATDPVRVRVVRDGLPAGKEALIGPQGPLGSRIQIVDPQSIPDVFANGFE